MKGLCFRVDESISIYDMKELFTNHPIELVRYMYIVGKVCEGEEKIILCPKKILHIGYSAILPDVEIELKKTNNNKYLYVNCFLSSLGKLKIILALISTLIFQMVLLLLNTQYWIVLLIVSTGLIVLFAFVFILDIYFTVKRINKYIKDIVINKNTEDSSIYSD